MPCTPAVARAVGIPDSGSSIHGPDTSWSTSRRSRNELARRIECPEAQLVQISSSPKGRGTTLAIRASGTSECLRPRAPPLPMTEAAMPTSRPMATSSGARRRPPRTRAAAPISQQSGAHRAPPPAGDPLSALAGQGRRSSQHPTAQAAGSTAILKGETAQRFMASQSATGAARRHVPSRRTLAMRVTAARARRRIVTGSHASARYPLPGYSVLFSKAMLHRAAIGRSWR